MFRDTEVYSVAYNISNKKWTVYINGMPMPKSENPGGIGGQYNYHEYDKKKTAVKKARSFAKKDRNRSQLKIQSKRGRVIETADYDGDGNVIK